MEREYSITEIVTLGMPDQRGKFYLEVRAENLVEGEDETVYLEMDFARFYDWFDEVNMEYMKKEYAKNYLKIDI